MNYDVYGKCFWIEDWSLNCETDLLPPIYIATNIFQSSIEFLDVMLANGSNPTQQELYFFPNMDEEKKNKFVGLLRIYENNPFGFYYQKDINELMISYCCQKRNINSIIYFYT